MGVNAAEARLPPAIECLLGRSPTRTSMPLILVIEDSSVSMALTTAILQSAGHTVLQADTAAEGIEIARHRRPDLILMDLQLPDADGLDVTRILKADPQTAMYPVVALTAFAMKGDEEAARAAGCDGYVAKPIRYKEFLAETQRVLERHRTVNRS